MFRRRNRDDVGQPTNDREVATEDRRPLRRDDERVAERRMDEPGGTAREERVDRPRNADDRMDQPGYREERVERRTSEPADA